jgi:hypothetical protein
MGTGKKTCLVCGDDDVSGGQCPWPSMQALKICTLCESILTSKYVKSTGAGLQKKFDIVSALIHVDAPL